jgi:hypothetical protein
VEYAGVETLERGKAVRSLKGGCVGVVRKKYEGGMIECRGEKKDTIHVRKRCSLGIHCYPTA